MARRTHLWDGKSGIIISKHLHHKVLYRSPRRRSWKGEKWSRARVRHGSAVCNTSHRDGTGPFAFDPGSTPHEKCIRRRIPPSWRTEINISIVRRHVIDFINWPASNGAVVDRWTPDIDRSEVWEWRYPLARYLKTARDRSLDLKSRILNDSNTMVFFSSLHQRFFVCLSDECPKNRGALISRVIDVWIRSSRRLIAREYCERLRCDYRCQMVKQTWHIKVQYFLLFLFSDLGT